MTLKATGKARGPSARATGPNEVARGRRPSTSREDVARHFGARHSGAARGDLGPQTVARAALGAAMAAFACWARHDADDLTGEVDRAFRLLATGFDENRLRVEQA